MLHRSNRFLPGFPGIRVADPDPGAGPLRAGRRVRRRVSAR